MSASQDNSSLLNGPWGLLPGIKMDESLRLGFQNIGGFPESPLHPKNYLIRSFVLKNEFDIFGLAESNVNWSQLNASAQFHERILHTWDKTHASLAYNRTVTSRSPSSLRAVSSFHQYGGVALLSTTQAAHRVSKSGLDPTGLGRWTWTSYQGRSFVSLKVVAAYRPCLSDGPSSTYSQQVNYLYDQNGDRCPRLAFLEDLSKEIGQWIQAGEQVIVMLDANSDVRDGDVNQMFFEAGMREVLLEINADLPVTSTFSRNLNNIPIDGIFATSTIQLQAGG
jgi:hypothetical protein